MIASNFIRYPDALRFQRELFHNGYKNQPRIMRAMECIFKFTPDMPQWVKDAKRLAKQLVKHWKKAQVVLNFAAAAVAVKRVMATKYKLNMARDVDTDEPGVYILNLPMGWRFDDGGGFNPRDSSHVRGFDTIQELRDSIKNEVIQCSCDDCTSHAARTD